MGSWLAVLSGMAVVCSELTCAQKSIPSRRVLSLELVLPQQWVLNILGEEF